MGLHSAKPVIEWHGWIYEVEGEVLVASHGGVPQIRLPLAPLIEGERTTIEEWREAEANNFVGRLDQGSTVHVAVDCGHVCYWIETDIEQFATLTYFPGLTFQGEYWQTYTSDEHDRRWDIQLDQEVGISSAYDGPSPFGADGAGMTDPGDFPVYWIWNIPVRAYALQTNAGWVGFSLPGALPVGLVRLSMERQRLSVNFDALRPACEEGMMPRVYLVTGLAGPYDLLDEHRIISDNLGLTVAKSADHPSWWSSPEYYYWDDFCRLQREDPQAAARKEIMTAEQYVDWLHSAKEIIGLREMNVTMEQGCYNLYGDYRPTEQMGGVEGFRRIVDQLHAEGTRVAYYIHPHMCNAKVAFSQEHPEAFCTPKDSAYKTQYPLEYDIDKPEFRLFDWTHPLAREYMLEQVRMLLSDEPGCLNCDILRSNHWRSPDPRLYDFHDPDWGIGDLMTRNVQRLMYQTAKRIKPECMVSKIGIADPYMQPWADTDFLCEEWNGYTDNWYRRGQIATRTISGLLFLTDPYFVTLTKGYEYYMGMMAWNYPSTNAVRHAIHPYTYYRELQEKDFKRRNAGFHTYLNAPLRAGDASRVTVLDDGEVEQWRKRTSGRLAGFYAALAIGKRTLVTYSETEARLATTITRTVEFPLPPTAHVQKVEMVPHEGEPVSWAYENTTANGYPGLRMHVEDCGKTALYYRISYRLAQ